MEPWNIYEALPEAFEYQLYTSEKITVVDVVSNTFIYGMEYGNCN